MSDHETPMDQARYEDVRSRMNAASAVVTRLLLAGQTDIAKMIAETEWWPLHEEFTRLLREDVEATE